MLIVDEHDQKRDTNLHVKAEQKFGIWSATTAGLLWAKLKMEDEEVKMKNFRRHGLLVIENIHESSDPFTREPDDGEYQNEIGRIVSLAMELDSHISRQVSKVTWDFSESNTYLTLDPESMEIEKGESGRIGKTKVQVVVQPALKK